MNRKNNATQNGTIDCIGSSVPAMSSPRNELIKMVKLLAESKKVINDLIKERVQLTNELKELKLNLDRTKKYMTTKERKLFEERKSRESRLLEELKLKETKLAREIKWRERLMAEQIKKTKKESKCTETDEHLLRKSLTKKTEGYLSENLEKSTQYTEITGDVPSYLDNNSACDVEIGPSINEVSTSCNLSDLKLTRHASNFNIAVQVDSQTSLPVVRNCISDYSNILHKSRCGKDKELITADNSLNNKTNVKIKHRRSYSSRLQRPFKNQEIAKNLNKLICSMKKIKRKKMKKKTADESNKADLRIQLLETHMKELEILKLKQHQQNEEFKQQHYLFHKLIKNVHDDELQWKCLEEKVNKLNATKLSSEQNIPINDKLNQKSDLNGFPDMDFVDVPLNRNIDLSNSEDQKNYASWEENPRPHLINDYEEFDRLKELHIKELKKIRLMSNGAFQSRDLRVRFENEGSDDNNIVNNITDGDVNVNNSHNAPLDDDEDDDVELNSVAIHDEGGNEINQLGKEVLRSDENFLNKKILQRYLKKIHEENFLRLKKRRKNQLVGRKNNELIAKINKLLQLDSSKNANCYKNNNDFNNNINLTENVTSSYNCNNESNQLQQNEKLCMENRKPFNKACAVDACMSDITINKVPTAKEFLFEGSKNKEIDVEKNNSSKLNHLTDGKIFSNSFGHGESGNLIQYVPLHKWKNIGSCKKRSNVRVFSTKSYKNKKIVSNTDDSREMLKTEQIKSGRHNRNNSSLTSISAASLSIETAALTGDSSSLKESELLQKEAIENLLIENVGRVLKFLSVIHCIA
ncbi:hypothetical protein HELRODRAFT_161154 [Helobdella robusta]|uniref:Uncharacterized protein n=1 Tax=Helobdella robusta TaxID=6412 RepID=T1ER57_HELRO|nr:hypothetical protein HELRODRAFT_161154 [Helobdella robusta]ESO01947.1 hypothetical protein HELRODRAFT_161154 [Helobdella robusta]